VADTEIAPRLAALPCEETSAALLDLALAGAGPQQRHLVVLTHLAAA